MLRPATVADAPMLARLHVQTWRETYPGLLPDAEIASRTIETRTAQWTAQFAAGTSRIVVIPDLGFAQSGPQRGDLSLAPRYPDELQALYLLRAGQGRGLGQALFQAVRGEVPFTAMVLDANTRACRFYERYGGVLLDVRDELIGQTLVRDRIYGWG